MDKLLQDLRDRASTITDRLGMPIDPGILELVVLLWAHGFPTAASCEGHAEEGRCRYPYVWVAWPDHGKRREAMRRQKVDPQMLEYRRQMIDLLNDFLELERDDHSDRDARLVMEDRGIFGGFCLQPEGAELLSLLPRELLSEQAHTQILARYHVEIAEFCKFLKSRLEKGSR